MDLLHKIVSPGLFYAAAGMNMLAGATLIASPLGSKDELLARFAQKFGGNKEQAKADVASLKGTELQVRGKGVMLFGAGALILCALRHSQRGDKTFLHVLLAAIAAGDVALLAIWGQAYAADKKLLSEDGPLLPTERAVAPLGLGYAAVEALAFGSYLWSCTKH